MQETSISQVLWSLPQIETDADSSDPPIFPRKMIVMEPGQQHRPQISDREKVIIYSHLARALKDCRAQGVFH